MREDTRQWTETGELLAGDLIPPVEDEPPEQTREWFLGTVEPPTAEPTDPDGVAQMRVELATNPLLELLRGALDHIGDGLRVTARGRPYAADMRRFQRARTDGRDTYGGDRCFGAPGLDAAVDRLLQLGWVEVADRMLRPVGTPALSDPSAPNADVVQAAREVFAAALRAAQEPDPWGARPADAQVLHDALLIASGPEGLRLPWVPYNGQFLHCDHVVHFLVDLLTFPNIRQLPLDRRTGHPQEAALVRLQSLRDTMDHLARRGLISTSGPAYDEDDIGDAHYRAPLIIRGVIAQLREPESFTGATRSTA